MITLEKIGYLPIRILNYLRELPLRVYRWIRHIWRIGYSWKPRETSWHEGMLFWIMELFFLSLDIIGFPEIYEFAIEIGKKSSRKLSNEEIREAKRVFGSTIDLARVRVDDRAIIGTKKHHFAYVSYYTINLYGLLKRNLLIHELVHIWQYRMEGSSYIPNSLKAQRSKAGYNYGGIAELAKRRDMGLDLYSFNFEQQADIVSDFYRILNGEKPHWGNGTLSDLSTYGYYVKSVNPDLIDFEHVNNSL